MHTDGIPLMRSTKSSIWPYSASIVELSLPIRKYQTNGMLLWLYAVVKSKAYNFNVFVKRTVQGMAIVKLFFPNERS